MARTRRPGEESKALLIEAVAEIINSEGYAALSARRLAEKVGLKRQIVHYYFRTMDDLLIAVIRHYGELGLARFSQAFASQDPLRVIWETPADASATTFAFLAMATHSPVIRAELRRYLEAFRELQIEAVARYMDEIGIEDGPPPEAAVIILQGVAQAMAAETALGTELGHDTAKAAIEQWLLSGANRNGRSG